MPSPASRRTIVARGFVAVVTTCALSAQSGPRWTTPTPAEVDAVFPDVDALYVTLHRSPELGFQEVQTAATLAARLKALGFDVTTGVGKTGIVGILKNGAGPTVMLRTELDALPVEEKTGLPFASTSRHEERGRTIYPRDARVRPRSPHGRLDRNRAAHGRTSRPLERHAHDGGTTSGRRTRRRTGDVDRRPVHALPQTRLRIVASR